MSACLSSLVASIDFIASSTTFFTSAAFSESDFGSLSIVLSKSTLSVAVPQLNDIAAFTCPSAFDVAAFKSKSPTVAETSAILAFFKASLIIF